MTVLFGQAAALPCVLDEHVQIARLLTAYDRWLVCCLPSHHDLKAMNRIVIGTASVVDQWPANECQPRTCP